MPPRLVQAFLIAVLFGSMAWPVRGSSLTFQVTDLGAMAPVGLNDSGQVALNQTVGGSTQAILYNAYGSNAGQMTFVGQGLPGVSGPSSNNFAAALTSSGQVVVETPLGWFLTDGRTYQATSPIPIVDPLLRDGMIVRGNASNAQGMVVGTNMLGQAALFDGSKLITLNSALDRPNFPFSLDRAIAINAMNQILVDGSVPFGTGLIEHAFLLTPDGSPTPANPTIAPEPGTLAILGLAIGSAWLWRRNNGRANR